MTRASAGASTRATSGTALRSLRRPGSPASTRSAPAMGRSSRSAIRTATCGLSRRSPRDSRAGSTDAMDFLVEFEVDVPMGTAPAEVEDRERAEAVAATQLADEGHLL